MYDQAPREAMLCSASSSIGLYRFKDKRGMTGEIFYWKANSKLEQKTLNKLCG